MGIAERVVEEIEGGIRGMYLAMRSRFGGQLDAKERIVALCLSTWLTLRIDCIRMRMASPPMRESRVRSLWFVGWSLERRFCLISMWALI